MKISEIITDKYKLRIPPTVYYDLLADVIEAEEEQQPTPKNDNQILEDIKGEILEQYWGDSREEYFTDNDSKEYREGAIEAADYIIKMIDKHRSEIEP